MRAAPKSLSQIATDCAMRLLDVSDATRATMDLYDWAKRRQAINSAHAHRQYMLSDNGAARAAFLTLKGIKP